MKFLRECFHVLKPGGILRLAVPDLELLIRGYTEAKKSSLKTVHAELPADAFVRSLLVVREAAPRGLVDRWFKPVLGKHTIHCWAYDAQSLMNLGIESPTLKRQVFKRVALKYLCDARQDIKNRIAEEIDASIPAPSSKSPQPSEV